MAPSYAYAPRAPSEYLPTLYWVSDGGRGEPKQVGRVTPCAPLCPPISRRARSDAPYPPSLRHYHRELAAARSQGGTLTHLTLSLVSQCHRFMLGGTAQSTQCGGGAWRRALRLPPHRPLCG